MSAALAANARSMVTTSQAWCASCQHSQPLVLSGTGMLALPGITTVTVGSTSPFGPEPHAAPWWCTEAALVATIAVHTRADECVSSCLGTGIGWTVFTL